MRRQDDVLLISVGQGPEERGGGHGLVPRLDPPSREFARVRAASPGDDLVQLGRGHTERLGTLPAGAPITELIKPSEFGDLVSVLAAWVPQRGAIALLNESRPARIAPQPVRNVALGRQVRQVDDADRRRDGL